MNTMSKIAIMTASVLSVGALTACQTTTAPKDAKGPHAFEGRHADRMDRKMTPEQREAFKARQAERKQVFEQIKTACDGKAVGQSVQIKAGEKTLEGTCNIHFKVDRKAMKADLQKMRAEQHAVQGEHRPMQAHVRAPMHQQQREPLTDAKRAELTQQYEQRLALRQAREQAMAQACRGQTNGKAVQIKIGEQTLNGQCEVRFQPKLPATPAPIKVT